MTSHDNRAQVEIGADTNPHPDAIELAEDTFRILILGDFGCHTASRPPLAERRIQRVDRDGIDAAIMHIAPALRFSIDPDSQPEVIGFRELDDFHPDQLLTNARTLARLRELRTSVESQGVPPVRQDSAAAPGQLPSLDTGSLLDRILEGEPPLMGKPPEPSPSRGDDLSDFIRRAVRPHVAREVDPQQRALVERVDDVLAATLRVLLHHPGFQALEALWRAVDLFVRRCDTGGSTAIGLFDLTQAELSAAATDAGGRRALMDTIARDGEGSAWTLVIAAFRFGAADVALLAEVAAMGEEMSAPWLTAADPRLAGTASFAGNGDMDDWEPSPMAGWDELRHARSARFLCLALPSFLVRLPYGTENPIDSMSFEELESGVAAHESFLWGNPAFLCGLVASTPVERGQPAPSQGTISRLPLHLATIDGAAEALPCAEVLLTQRAVGHLLGRGLTPLVSQRDGDAVRIPRLQSIAEPAAPLLIQPAARSA